MTVGRTNLHATRLRRDATDAESKLWHALRARQLGGFKFRRQATIGLYIADVLCAERRLVVEVDGGQHGGAGDEARDAAMVRLGYRVVRFTNGEVLANLQGVLEALLMLLEEAGPPSPNPHPERVSRAERQSREALSRWRERREARHAPEGEGGPSFGAWEKKEEAPSPNPLPHAGEGLEGAGEALDFH